MWDADTTPAAARVRIEALRRRTPGTRIASAFELSVVLRELAIAGERRRDPRLSAAEARRRVLRRLLGEELAARVWPEPRP